MARESIRNLVADLPRPLQDAVEGYVDAVQAALPDIERDASVQIRGSAIDDFLLIVAIRRIWATVNRQYWTMNDSIAITERTGANGFRVGRDEITRNSNAVHETTSLRQQFDQLLTSLEIRHLVIETKSLPEVARMMFSVAQ